MSAPATRGRLRAPVLSLLRCLSMYDRRLEQRVPQGRAPGTLLWMPWIPLHGDALIRGLPARDGLRLVPCPIFGDMADARRRAAVTRVARFAPAAYRALLLRALRPLASRAVGFVFTLDWHPAMRLLARVCGELGLARVLVPHESVFVDRDRYYRHPETGVGRPVCDLVLAWGALQRDLFVERGYPAERVRVVGAPKFDAHVAFTPSLDRRALHARWQLDPARRTVLFAAQPADILPDRERARAAQARALRDVADFAAARGLNLVARVPPSGEDVIPRELCQRAGVHVDGRAGAYACAPLEAIEHSDCVVSVNSTMLFEAALRDTPSVAARYVPFDSLWDHTGLPAASDREGLWEQLERALAEGGASLSEAGWRWARQALSAGAFDGQAGDRIADALLELAAGEQSVTPFDPVEQALQGEPLETVGVAHAARLGDTQRYLPVQLRAQRVAPVLRDPPTAAACDLVVQWGARLTPNKRRLRRIARRVGTPVVYVEDGFLRSKGLGLEGAPGLSLILDDLAPYYDATRPSRLETLLQGGPELSEAQRTRVAHLVRRIVQAGVSKYNHAPRRKLPPDPEGRRRVLLVDQRRGDASVEFGLASEVSFARMLQAALDADPEWRVLLKLHPDATLGGKGSYLAGAPRHARVQTLQGEYNPYDLLAGVEQTYVVTSGLGFESLLAGVPVRCFGLPFYAGWGCTQDEVPCPRRTRRRTVLDIAHFALIALSRYGGAGIRWGDVEAVVERLAE